MSPCKADTVTRVLLLNRHRQALGCLGAEGAGLEMQEVSERGVERVVRETAGLGGAGKRRVSSLLFQASVRRTLRCFSVTS